MTEQEAKAKAKWISRKTGYTCYAIYFHGSWVVSETIDHAGPLFSYRAGVLVGAGRTE